MNNTKIIKYNLIVSHLFFLLVILSYNIHQIYCQNVQMCELTNSASNNLSC